MRGGGGPPGGRAICLPPRGPVGTAFSGLLSGRVSVARQLRRDAPVSMGLSHDACSYA